MCSKTSSLSASLTDTVISTEPCNMDTDMLTLLISAGVYRLIDLSSNYSVTTCIKISRFIDISETRILNVYTLNEKSISVLPSYIEVQWQ